MKSVKKYLTVGLGETISGFGRYACRYSLVLVIAWIGLGKTVHFGAADLVRDSPLMSWIFDFVSPAVFGRILGTTEMLAATLIAIGPWRPLISAAGSLLAGSLFVGTLSFLFTTPGVIAGHVAVIPTLTERPGQFLLKDAVLISVSIWTLGESLVAGVTRTSGMPASRSADVGPAPTNPAAGL